MRKGIWYAIIAAFLMSVYHVLWKFGAMQPSFLNLYLFFGFIIYGIGALFIIFALKLEDLSSTIPILGLSYLFVATMAVWLLNEQFSIMRFAGMALIFTGVIMVGGFGSVLYQEDCEKAFVHEDILALGYL